MIVSDRFERLAVADGGAPNVLPIDKRFELTLHGGHLTVLLGEVYVVGTYGCFPIGRLRGDSTVDAYLIQSPWDALKFGGYIHSKLKRHGYHV